MRFKKMLLTALSCFAALSMAQPAYEQWLTFMPLLVGVRF